MNTDKLITLMNKIQDEYGHGILIVMDARGWGEIVNNWFDILIRFDNLDDLYEKALNFKKEDV